MKAFWFLLVFLFTCCFGQSVDSSETTIDTTGIVYLPVENDLFKGYEKSKLIVDYYYSDGYSMQDRYMFEIIITDSILMLAFSSPESDAFNKVNYQNQRMLTKDQMILLNSTLKDAKLKQLKEGVPHPPFSGHRQEVLIVKSKLLKIGGGMFNSTIFSNKDSKKSIEEQIRRERQLTSSIGGNYDLVFKLLRKFCIELDKLISKAQK